MCHALVPSTPEVSTPPPQPTTYSIISVSAISRISRRQPTAGSAFLWLFRHHSVRLDASITSTRIWPLNIIFIASAVLLCKYGPRVTALFSSHSTVLHLCLRSQPTISRMFPPQCSRKNNFQTDRRLTLTINKHERRISDVLGSVICLLSTMALISD